MKIGYIDIVEENLSYKIDNDVVFFSFEDEVYKLDFSKFNDGKLIGISGVPLDFITDAYKINGVLNLTLRKPVTKNGLEIPLVDFPTTECKEVEMKWKTQANIDEEELLESLIPTEDDIKNAELDIKIIELLQDLEVI